MYENWKILKTEADEKADEYTQVAEWCNENGQYTIEDDGTYYKVIKLPEPTQQEIAEQKIAELKAYLASTDYVVIKIAEGSATAEDYADLIAQRRAWREKINELEV
ncbi:MAG: hypothetical protein IJS88_02020 [Alphaproteobacteria bacterium]|nr:hypothetical protein [Alphaproteobacteria bacterium]